MDYRKINAKLDSQISQQLARNLDAAKEFVRLIRPGDDSILSDLDMRWTRPGEFAAKYPDWFIVRWGMDDPLGDDIDWDAEDKNAWSYVQDCLGVRRLLLVLGADAGAADLLGALDGAKVNRGEGFNWSGSLDENAILRGRSLLEAVASGLRGATELRLVQLMDYWSEDLVITTVDAADFERLSALALEADIYDQGMVELSAG
jgi:hypothetical protein